MKYCFYGLLTGMLVLLFGCSQDAENGAHIIRMEGQTMGTTWHVTYLDSLRREYRADIQQLLDTINNEVSTYVENSVISRFNRSDSGIVLKFWQSTHPYFVVFQENWIKSRQVWEASDGWFEPTIMPLVNYWGFGYTEKRPVTEVDSAVVDSLLQCVGFDKVHLRMNRDHVWLTKDMPCVQLDFSAIAKGQAVDAVGRLLEGHGIRDYLVEIGGEVRARGNSPRGTPWLVGINTPDPRAPATEIIAKVALTDKALATSGNYRNFFEVEGRKYAHIINPRTGYPQQTDLLSVSVLADECALADAWATALMAMGLDAAWEKANQMGLEVYFIYGKPDGTFGIRHTEGFGRLLQ